MARLASALPGNTAPLWQGTGSARGKRIHPSSLRLLIQFNLFFVSGISLNTPEA